MATQGGNPAPEQARERHLQRRAEVPSSSVGPEIEDYLTHLRIERGSAANTLSSYRNDLLRYGAFLLERGITELRTIDETLIADFLHRLSTGDDGGSALSQRSMARVLASVRGAHRYWAGEGRTTHDPAKHVAAPKPRQSLPKALSVDEVQRLLDAPSRDTELGRRDRALLEFLYATGARITEAVSLDVDDIHEIRAAPDGDSATTTPGAAAAGPEAAADSDSSAGSSAADGLVIVRVTGKGNKQRMVPVGRYAQRAINDYLTAGRPGLAAKIGRRAPSPGLFLNKLGGRLSRQSAWTVLQTHAAAAEIAQEVSPHTLRHSCATHLLEGGAGIRLVQEMLGHASVTTTQIYTKVTAEALQESYAIAHPRAR
ncbi:site-specific tyrosine recombinase XerD [Nesterenkonia jeotgali]|uniref:Tyrosine recombinase XerC n=1 Tax=Nesterenkonia jeotgali TaxID=317018 RepID=A0A0W8ICK6_9MICC|nr:site-specific tyrosine recombinase XerD [Nesterenkonia jeotgali]KUG57665.1 recombinase XerD [Nesterenkonia jeotgali]MBA8920363.1 integrase/recombinase XerD [Nesterenkonia jeotgali]